MSWMRSRTENFLPTHGYTGCYKTLSLLIGSFFLLPPAIYKRTFNLLMCKPAYRLTVYIILSRIQVKKEKPNKPLMSHVGAESDH